MARTKTQTEQYRGFDIYDIHREGGCRWVANYSLPEGDKHLPEENNISGECEGRVGTNRVDFLEFVHGCIDKDIANWGKQCGKKWES